MPSGVSPFWCFLFGIQWLQFQPDFPGNALHVLEFPVFIERAFTFVWLHSRHKTTAQKGGQIRLQIQRHTKVTAPQANMRRRTFQNVRSSYLSVSSRNLGVLLAFHCEKATDMVYRWNSRRSIHLTASRAEIQMFRNLFVYKVRCF